MSGLPMRRNTGREWAETAPPGTFDIEPDHSIRYVCPNGRHCGVPITRDPNTKKAWQWDGNEEKPTLTPSIHCHGCGWHGFITKGEMTTV